MTDLIRRDGGEPASLSERLFAVASITIRRQFYLSAYTPRESFRHKEAERAPADPLASIPQHPAR